MRQKFIINCVTFLLQNAIVITKFVDFIIKCVGTMSNKLRMMSKTWYYIKQNISMSKNHIQTFLEVIKSRARESNKGEKREFIFDLAFSLYHAFT